MLRIGLNLDLSFFIERRYLVDFIATAKAVRTQRLKSPLVMQSPPTRTNQKNVLTNLATAIYRNPIRFARLCRVCYRASVTHQIENNIKIDPNPAPPTYAVQQSKNKSTTVQLRLLLAQLTREYEIPANYPQ
jgi:hypothetical protein